MQGLTSKLIRQTPLSERSSQLYARVREFRVPHEPLPREKLPRLEASPFLRSGDPLSPPARDHRLRRYNARPVPRDLLPYPAKEPSTLKPAHRLVSAASTNAYACRRRSSRKPCRRPRHDLQSAGSCSR